MELPVKKILITGADGFFGQHLLRELEQRGISSYLGLVIQKNPLLPEDKQVTADITEPEIVRSILERYQPDVIIHLAAIASVTYGNVPELYRVNICGSENILEAAKQVCKKGTRVILISSAGVYGIQQEAYLTEELPLNPVNHYSYTKMVMEILSRQYSSYLDIKIVRPFTIIGKGQSSNFFISKLVKGFAERKPVLELGNIQSVRDYTDVELCAFTLAELACRETVPEQIMNICTEEETKGTDVIELLKTLTGFEPEIHISEECIRENEIWRLVGDNQRLKNFLGESFHYKKVKKILEEMLQSQGFYK